MNVLVHAVVAAEVAGSDLVEEADDGDGVDIVADGTIAALVSRSDQEILPTAAWLRRHARVVEHASERATVVPMRFGVVVPSVEALVQDVLVGSADTLHVALQRLHGMAEYRLRGRYVEEEVLRRVVARDRQAARLRGSSTPAARIELGERIVNGIEQQREQDTMLVLDMLETTATASVRHPVSEPLDALDLALLVDRARLESFDAAVDAVGGATSPLITLELVGPMPAYSFADPAN